jgi:predicted ATPase
MWYLRLLGDLSLEREGVTMRRFRAQKYASLLAFLALHPGRAFSRDELIDRFWPDADFEAGRICLRTALSSLRRQLSLPEGMGGGELFREGDRAAVALNPGVLTTDVLRFEQRIRRAASVRGSHEEIVLLSEASALYGGPLLPGLWDEWVLVERERLEEEYRRLLERFAVMEGTRTPASGSVRAKEPETPPARYPKDETPALLRLPLILSGYHGREAERGFLDAWLRGRALQDGPPRLVTITGLAGIGKTRLASEAAHRAAAAFPGAVCFVSLAPCADAGQIPEAIAAALAVERGSGRDPLEAVASLLEGVGPSLLILDNMEHLAEEGGALLVRALLARLSRLTILVTSRQSLQLEGEQVLPLGGLAPSAASALFVEKARSVRPDFAATEKTAATVTALCAQLDSIPLAIELCAAWAHLLSPGQMVERLNHRFDLLTSRRRDTAARHRSVHAALEWGFDLDPDTRLFFAALSVFRGGWTLAAAEAVTGDAGTLERLSLLRDRSLVVVDTENAPEGEMRCRFLETVREFADEQLTPEERETFRRRHLAYFLDFARTISSHLVETNAESWFTALEREDANIRAAITFGVEGTADEITDTLRLIQELRWPWWVRGHHPDVRGWILRAYENRDRLTGVHRADLLTHAALYREAREAECCCHEAIALAEAAECPLATCGPYRNLAVLAEERGDWAEGIAYLERAVAVHEDRQEIEAVGYYLADIAGLYVRAGQWEAAHPVLQRCRAIACAADNSGSVAKIDLALAGLELKEGRGDVAERLCRQSLDVFRQKGETWNIADTLKTLGASLRIQNRNEEGRAYLNESLILFVQLSDAGQVNVVRSLLDAHEDL